MKQPHIAQRLERGETLGILKLQKKTFEGGPFGDDKTSNKSSTVPNKQRREPIVSSSFIRYIKNEERENRDTLQ